MGVPIDTEIERIKLEIEQVRLQLRQVSANMSSVRSHYQQGHIHGGGKVGGFVRAVQRSGKDASLRKQQPVKEQLQQEKLALEQQLNRLKILKTQGTTHITK
jgi:archaellum component FlaC